MPQQVAQNFENHVVIPRRLFFVAGLMLIGVLCALIGLFLVNSIAGVCLIGTGVLFTGCGGILGILLARSYSTTLQDRIIRAEMHARLGAVLPDDLRGSIPSLSIPQLVALRFASGEELTELVRRVLAEGIEDRTAIKKMVKDWQGDYARV